MAGRITKADMREAARALGIREDVADGEERKKARRKKRAAPRVEREYAPNLDAQDRAISALLSDVINEKGRCPDAPNTDGRRSHDIRATRSLPQS